MAPTTLTLYGRADCHLCEEMKDIVRSLAREFGCETHEIDIGGQPDLEARFGEEIPVLFVNGRKAFKYRLTERELRQRLRTEQGRAPAPAG